MDLALAFDPARIVCDLTLAAGDLALDATPAPALLVSLGTDGRAKGDDPLPAGAATGATLGAGLGGGDGWPADRRGWWGDAIDPDGAAIGCRLWLLAREKATDSVRRRAEDYAAEGLAWAVAAGRAVTVSAGWRGTRLVLHVVLGRAVLDLPVAGG